MTRLWVAYLVVRARMGLRVQLRNVRTPAGAIVALVAVPVLARSWWVGMAPQMGGADGRASQGLLAAHGVAALALMLWFRAARRPPILLQPADLAVGDMRRHLRGAVVAGLVGRLVRLLLLSALLIGLAPLVVGASTSWSQSWLRWCGWLVLLALIDAVRSAVGALGVGLGWHLELRFCLVALLGLLVLSASEGDWRPGSAPWSEALLGVLVGDRQVILAALAAAVLLVNALVVWLSPQLLPVWAPGLHLAGAISAVAEAMDMAAALAMTSAARVPSRRGPRGRLLVGARATVWRVLVQYTRVVVARGIVVQFVGAGLLSWCAARWLPALWWVVAATLAGTLTSGIRGEGTNAEIVTPLGRYLSRDLFSTLVWASVAPCIKSVLGGMIVVQAALGSDVPQLHLVLAATLAVAWPALGAAAAVFAEALAVQGDEPGAGSRLLAALPATGAAMAGLGGVAVASLGAAATATAVAAVGAVGVWAMLHVGRSLLLRRTP